MATKKAKIDAAKIFLTDDEREVLDAALLSECCTRNDGGFAGVNEATVPGYKNYQALLAKLNAQEALLRELARA